MGVELNVSFPAGRAPAWPSAAAKLAGLFAVQMRMIDGELAFPDEEPPETWRELRVAAGGAMVAIRRTGDGVNVVGWGNMDETQRRLWHALAWAFAAAGGGTVGGASADEFARQHGLADG